MRIAESIVVKLKLGFGVGIKEEIEVLSTPMVIMANANVADHPVDIVAEDFCANCQVCTKVCPPGAIFDDKQIVRGAEKWFVDFDKCILYFGEALGCAICIAKFPRSTPGRAPKLTEKMLARGARTKGN